MKCVVYSLFGAERARHPDSFDFHSYLRGFMINIRMNRLLFPDWRIYLQTDQATHEAYKNIFDKLDIEIEVHSNGVPLTLAMLWRLRPIFEMKDGYPKWSHILCRDTDSPPTYREAQAVKYWVDHDRAAHSINDSVSHTIPMLGGMIGFRPRYFKDLLPVNSWSELIQRSPEDWTKKGSDQTFLNKIVYPCFAKQGSDSITQHAFKGLPNTFLSDYKTCLCDSVVGHEPRCPNNIELDIPYELSESNNVCGHIGAAGFYHSVLFKFLRKHKDKFTDILEIEKQYPIIFHWVNDNTFE